MSELDMDRYYDSLDKSDSKIDIEEYYELEKKYDELLYQMKDVIYFLTQDDAAGAYEYLKGEGLV